MLMLVSLVFSSLGAVSPAAAGEVSGGIIVDRETGLLHEIDAINTSGSVEKTEALTVDDGGTAKTRAELQKQVKFVNEENRVLKTQIVNLAAENADIKSENVEQSSEIQTLKDDKAEQDKLIQQLLDRVEKLEKGGAAKSAPVVGRQRSGTVQPKPEINITKPDTLQEPVSGRDIQVSSSTRKSDSQQLAGRLNAKGYNAFVGKGVVKGRTYYRTFVDGGDNPQAVLVRLKSAGINGFIFR